MDRNLLKQAIATAEDLGDGLFRITDSTILAALPCLELVECQEFRSYRQLSRDLCNDSQQQSRTCDKAA